MLTPRPYVHGYSFTGWQANNPHKPLPATALDDELEKIALSLADTIDGLGQIRRSDGKLQNGVVTREALAPELSIGVAPASVVVLSGQLSAAATAIEINGLEPDTVYEGACLVVAAANGGFGWQSRFTSGGAWDTGGSDYANQTVVGAGTTASASAGSANYGPIATKDAALPQLPPIAHFVLYTGSASRRAVVTAYAGYVTTDGVNAVAATLFSQRVTNGAIASVRFTSTASNGLGAGSRVVLRKLI